MNLPYTCLFRFICCWGLVILLFLGGRVNLWAQHAKSNWYEPSYIAKVWDNKAGLPQNSIFDIEKDEKGFLWIATEEGLVRFDGNQFLVFDDTDLPAGTSDLFSDIIISGKGGIWAASDNAVIKATQNKVKAYDASFLTQNSRITCLAEDKEGGLWVGTNAGDLLLLQKGSISRVQAWPYAGKKTIQSLSFSKEGLLIGTNAGLYRFKKPGNTLTPIAGFETKHIRKLLEAPDGSLWVGTQAHGLFHVTRVGTKNYGLNAGLKELFITALGIAPNGTVWAGTSSSGALYLQDDTFVACSAKGLPADGVRSIAFTEPGLMWLGTGGSGLVQVKEAEVHMLSAAFPLSGNIALPLYEHANGDIWIGTAGSGINRISKAKTTSYTTAQGLAGNLILSIGGTKDAIYIGTANGLNRFNLTEEKIDKVYTTDHGLASNVVLAVLQDAANTLWITTRSGGIHTLGQDGKLHRIPLPARLATAEISCILEDKQKNKWFGSHGAGLIKISPAGTLQYYTAAQGLPGSEITSMYQDAQGAIWLTTDKGLVCFTGNRFIVLNKSNGLLSDAVYHIMGDGSDALWLSGTHGLQRILWKDLEKVKKNKNATVPVQLYDTSDGMNNAEVNGGVFPAGITSSDGKLWFPTVDGVALVDPAAIAAEKEKVNIFIDGLRYCNTGYALTKNITLPPGTCNLEINYTSINFNKPAAVKFYYRLKGVNTGWDFADERRTAYFSMLAPGDYTFEVKAEQGGIASEPAQLSFTIKPFFHQTGWFKALLFFLLFLAGFLVKKFLTKHQQEAQLKALVEARTRDLHESNERFRLVNKATSDIIWDYDLTREKLYWGDNFESLLGHTPVTSTRNVQLRQDNLHPQDLDRVTATFQAAITGQALRWEEEYRFRKGDHQYAYIIDRGYILRDENGKATRMLGAMQDVTKAKQEEERLKVLESVITNATDAVLITDTTLGERGPSIIYVNEAFTRMTGYQREEVLGKTPRLLQGERSDRAELDKLKAALQKGRPCEIEIVNYHKNNSSYFVNINVSPVVDQKGVLTHFISIQRNVTERREYLQAVEEHNAKLNEIRWMQSHVVRAPLARILGLINLLQESPRAQSDQANILGYIRDAGNELDGVIRDIVKKAENVATKSGQEKGINPLENKNNGKSSC